MARAELKKVMEREEMLEALIKRFGMESEPTLYFAKWAWKDLNNAKVYYKTASNWVFNWDE